MDVKEPTFRAMSMREFSAIDPQAKSIVDSYGVAVPKSAAREEEGMSKFASFRQNLVQDPYPSPFLNLSDTKIPNKMSELFELCRYFYMFDPLIAGAINSLATFPVTNLYLDESKMADKAKVGADGKKTGVKDDSPQLKTYKKTLFENINLNKLLIEIGIDYWLYGNCFIFGEFWTNPDTKQKEWRHVVRLDPSRMIIDHNEATREIKYKWMIPEKIRRIVTMKKPMSEYEKIPDLVKRAVTKNEALVINPNNIFHFSRPTDSMGDTVWGTPVIANVMKLLMYRNVMRQAQEAIAREHIVPFRIYYFERNAQSDPMVNWGGVTADFAAELNKSSKDPNYKVISPLPVNVLNLGGNGRALMLTPEIEQVQGEILAGMNVPREFIFGGVTWSGSSISLKILENQFITYRLLIQGFLNFLVKNMAKVRNEWHSEEDNDAIPSIHMQDLKMQDDVQQKQLIVQMNQANKLPDEQLYKAMDMDPEKIVAGLEAEAIKRIETDKKMQILRIDANEEVQEADITAQVKLALFKERLRIKMSQSTDEVERNVAMQMFGMGATPQPQVDAMGNPIPGPVGPGGAPGAPPAGPGGAPGTDPTAPPAGPGQPMAPTVAMADAGDVQDPAAGKDKANVPDQIDSVNVGDTKDIDAEIQRISAMPDKQRAAALTQLPAAQQKAIAMRMEAMKSRENYGKGYADAQALAERIVAMPERQQEAALNTIPVQMRDRVMVFVEQLQMQQQDDQKAQQVQQGQAQQGQGPATVDMRPMPEQKPPRRKSLNGG